MGIYRQGRIIHTGAYGMANIDLNSIVEFSSTKFQLGSIGKLFTSIAVLKEVESGRLSLDDDINGYLSEFKVTSPSGKPITLRHLLLHTAGFNERVIGYAAASPEELEPLSLHLKKRMPDTYIDPGKEISYSNYGFGLAGHLVELSSGMEYMEYIGSEILRPLAMTNTSYYLPGINEAGHAMGYELNENFDLVQPLPRHVVPAGSISSTGEDMMKFVSALLTEDERLLSSHSYSLLTQELFTPHPSISGHAFGIEVQNFNGHIGFAKGGNIPGFLAYVILFPQYDLGIFTVVNTETDNFLELFTERFKERFFPKVQKRQIPPLPGIDLHRFLGEYRANRYNRNTIEDLFGLIAGSSTIYISGDSTLMLYHNGGWKHYRPIAPLVFQNTSDQELHLVFEENENGKVIKMHRNVIIGGFMIPMTFEPVGRFQTVEFINEYAGLFPLFLFSYFLFPIGWLIIWVLRRKKPDFYSSRTFTSTTRLVILSFLAVILIHIVGGIYPIIRLGNDLIFGVPRQQAIFLSVGYLLIPLWLVLFYRTIKVWKYKEGQLWTRIYLSLFSLSGLVYLLILHRWHFIGMNI